MQWGANKGTDVAEEEFVEEMEDDEEATEEVVSDEVERVEEEESLLLEGWAFPAQKMVASGFLSLGDPNRRAPLGAVRLLHGGCRKRKATNCHRAQ